MELEDRLQGGQFESLPADKAGPGPAKCESECLLLQRTAIFEQQAMIHSHLLRPPSLQLWRAG